MLSMRMASLFFSLLSTDNPTPIPITHPLFPFPQDTNSLGPSYNIQITPPRSEHVQKRRSDRFHAREVVFSGLQLPRLGDREHPTMR
jgi:hypothetical protein